MPLLSMCSQNRPKRAPVRCCCSTIIAPTRGVSWQSPHMQPSLHDQPRRQLLRSLETVRANACQVFGELVKGTLQSAEQYLVSIRQKVQVQVEVVLWQPHERLCKQLRHQRHAGAVGVEVIQPQQSQVGFQVIRALCNLLLQIFLQVPETIRIVSANTQATVTRTIQPQRKPRQNRQSGEYQTLPLWPNELHVVNARNNYYRGRKGHNKMLLGNGFKERRSDRRWILSTLWNGL
jgi:hypothetical protein